MHSVPDNNDLPIMRVNSDCV